MACVDTRPASEQQTYNNMLVSHQGNTCKTTRRGYVAPVRTAIRKTMRDDCWRHVEMRNPGTVLVGMESPRPLLKMERGGFSSN